MMVYTQHGALISTLMYWDFFTSRACVFLFTYDGTVCEVVVVVMVVVVVVVVGVMVVMVVRYVKNFIDSYQL